MIGVKEAHWAEQKTINDTKSVSYARFAVYDLDISPAIPSVEKQKASENTFFSLWKKNILRDKAFVKKYFKPDPNSEISGQILLIILGLLLGSTAIVYLSLGFACTLSCNGYNFAAILVLLLGLVLLFGLWRFGNKKIQVLWDKLKKLEAEEKRNRKKKLQEEKKNTLPKTDAQPIAPAPTPPKTKSKKQSKEEIEKLEKVDNRVLFVKIITIAVLIVLIVTMIVTSIFI